MSVLVVGSVALDSIKTPKGTVQEALGGSATYFSYSASFFTPVRLVAVVGEDFPQKHLKLLENKGIALEGLEQAHGRTFRWTGSYEKDMNSAQTHATELNVFQDFDPKIPVGHQSTPHLFLANIDPDLQLRVLDKMKKPKLIGCDTMNLWINIKLPSLKKLLKRVDFFLLNEGEARLLTKKANLIEAAHAILKMGPKGVVIKKGEHGAILLTKKFMFVSPAYPLPNVVDPTGAGDCFAGGFFGSVAQSGRYWDPATLKKSVLLGTLMASFNVESFSLERLKRVTQPEIKKRLQTFLGYTQI